MGKIWKSLWTRKPDGRFRAAAMLLLLMLVMAPLFRLARYAVPWYDDYNYGRFAKTAMTNAPTVGNAIKGAWECIRISWHAWQGTYASIFFMVMMPGIWGESYYFLGPVFLIVLLTVSVFALGYALLRGVLGAKRWEAVYLSACAACVALLLLHTAQAGIYWYNGGVHYVGMHAFGMLLAAALIRLFYAEGLVRKIVFCAISAALSLLTAGGNFVTALQGALLYAGVLLICAWTRRRKIAWLLPGFCVYLAGFYLNVTAPGNAVRADNYTGWGMPPLEAVLHSFAEAGRYAWPFTGWMTVVLLLLAWPVILETVRESDFAFRKPGIVTLASFCFYATGFTPSLYSLGHAGLGRTLNAVKLTWQLLLFLNVVYWSGYVCKKRERSDERAVPAKGFGVLYYAAVLLLVIPVFCAEPNKAGSFSSYGAYYYVHTGMANNFYQEYLERVTILKGAEPRVTLKPYQWKPWLICMGDIDKNPKSESNRALAEWYGKDEVRLDESRTE